MKEHFWKFVAHFIANRTWLVNWIIRSAAKRPYFHLDGYMNRWWLTPSWLLTKDENGNSIPYPWLPTILKCRVHHILRADDDRHLHDHPADNRSIVLRGYYDEQDIFGRSNIRSPGQTVFRRAECFHKIAYVSSRGVWTLWFLGERKNEWGFLVEGRKICQKIYLRGKQP
jgi:hypothetical protein